MLIGSAFLRCCSDKFQLVQVFASLNQYVIVVRASASLLAVMAFDCRPRITKALQRSPPSGHGVRKSYWEQSEKITSHMIPDLGNTQWWRLKPL